MPDERPRQGVDDARSRATTPRAVRSQETRQRIYHAALELFREHGYDQVTIRDICEAAGVAVGTFYHFFGSKDGTLLYGLAAEDESVDTLLAGLADASHVERIREIFLNRVFLGTENVGPELSIAFSVAEMRNGQPGAVSANHRVYGALLEEVHAAQEEGALTRGTEAGTLTEGLLYAAVGIIQVWRLSGGELPAREIAERHIEAILTLLRP